MQNNNYINKKQLLAEFGISRATFYRFIKRQGISVSRRLLSPAEATQLREALLQHRSYDPLMRQDETR